MKKIISSNILILAFTILEKNAPIEIEKVYNIKVDDSVNCKYALLILNALKKLPLELVKACGINSLGIKDLGPSKEFYPNHGVYVSNTLFLNKWNTEDPWVVEDSSGNKLDRFDHTLYHEMGHGLDEVLGGSKELSLQPEWLNLSDWSEEPKLGLKRIIIREKGSPELVGEWWYNPDSGYTRFYAKRNPWDDWADSFAYYVAGLKSYLPESKIRYFDDLIGKFFEE